jgi:hypothetical protein
VHASGVTQVGATRAVPGYTQRLGFVRKVRRRPVWWSTGTLGVIVPARRSDRWLAVASVITRSRLYRRGSVMIKSLVAVVVLVAVAGFVWSRVRRPADVNAGPSL